MLKHTVLWKLKDNALSNTKTENAQILKEKLLDLKDLINEIRQIEVGINVIDTPSSYDFILNVIFDNKEDLNSYIINEHHQKVASFVKEVTNDRVCIDYEI